MAVTSALAIQALLFADGGLLSSGINSLNMAITMPFAGHAVCQLIGGNGELRSARRLVGGAVGSYFDIVLAAFAAVSNWAFSRCSIPSMASPNTIPTI